MGLLASWWLASRSVTPRHRKQEMPVGGGRFRHGTLGSVTFCREASFHGVLETPPFSRRGVKGSWGHVLTSASPEEWRLTLLRSFLVSFGISAPLFRPHRGPPACDTQPGMGDDTCGRPHGQSPVLNKYSRQHPFFTWEDRARSGSWKGKGQRWDFFPGHLAYIPSPSPVPSDLGDHDPLRPLLPPARLDF